MSLPAHSAVAHALNSPPEVHIETSFSLPSVAFASSLRSALASCCCGSDISVRRMGFLDGSSRENRTGCLSLNKYVNLQCGRNREGQTIDGAFAIVAKAVFDEEDSVAEKTAAPTPGSDNGVAMIPTSSSLSSLEENSIKSVAHTNVVKGTEALSIGLPASSPSGGSGRAGLFRTPISGGVQSATSSHGLPHPALAVRNLMEQAHYAHLCTVMSRMHHRRRGYPFGSLVDFVPDSIGHPIFSLSPLAIHTRNLLADPRCTLVVQIPGWSGLSNARVTIFGDVFPLPAQQQEWAHKHYTAKHQQGATQLWGNFYYYRMESISDIYFIGGFGTVAWVDVTEFENFKPDVIAATGAEQTLKELNARFSKPLKEMLSVETEVDDAALISIDSKGTDIRVRQGAQFNVQRLSFEEGHPVETLDQAKEAVQKLLDRCI
eukprot:c24680_g1_i1 orf=151-1446(+)